MKKNAHSEQKKPTIRDRVVRLERIPARDLVANGRNWRTHPDAQRSAMRALLSEVGMAGAVIARELPGGRYEIIDGHMRAECVDDTIPVLVLDVTEEESAKLLAIMDPIAAMAGKDKAALSELVKSISFSSDELSAVVASLGAKQEPKESPAVDPSIDVADRWGVTPGDVWALGRHRLACGDCSDPRVMLALLGEDKPDVVVLDPPYEMSDAAWAKWINDPCIVFGQARHIRMIPDRLWRFERVVVKKSKHRSATVQIQHAHAFVVQCGSVKTLPADKRATMCSVIEQEDGVEIGEQKPVSLIVEHLTHWTPPGRIVLDPFAGSGSTVIACDQAGRDCRAIELDPQRAAAILQRWAEYSGHAPMKQ